MLPQQRMVPPAAQQRMVPVESSPSGIVLSTSRKDCDGGFVFKWYFCDTLGPWNPTGMCLEPYQRYAAALVWFSLIAANIFIAWNRGSRSLEQEAGRESEPIAKRRQTEWDFYRFVLEVLVVAHHAQHGTATGSLAALIKSFRMPAFVFIGGVFGRSMRYDSVANMFCCTAVACSLMSALKGSIGSANHKQLWFIWSVLVWRLTVTPFFYLTSKVWDDARMRALSFILVTAVSYFLYPLAFNILFAQEIVYFAPMFAFGILATPGQWMHVFEQSYFFVGSAVMIAGWVICAVLHHMITGQQNRSALNQIMKAIEEIGGDGDGPAICSYPCFIRDIILRLFISLCVLCLLTWFCKRLERHAPLTHGLVTGWGSRTLYVYALHTSLIKRTPAWMSTDHTAVVTCFWLAVLYAVFVNAIMGSEGAKLLFKWVLQPYWARRATENLVKWLLQRRMCSNIRLM